MAWRDAHQPRWRSPILIPIILGILLFLLLCVLWGVYGSSQVVHQPRYRPTNNPGDYGLQWQELSLKTSDGLRISAWLIRHPNPKGTLLLFHGFGTSKADLLDCASALRTAGSYQLLLIDFRGHGLSEGEILSFGKWEVLDVEAALHLVDQDPISRGLPVGCWGISMGGAIGILAAAQFQRIQAVVCEGSYANLPAAIARVQWMTYHIPRIPLGMMVIWATEIRLRTRLRHLSPARSIARVSPRSVLLVHGLEDTSIDAQESQRLFEAAREPKELWLIPGAEHVACFYRDPEGYTQRILRFFDRVFQRTTQTSPRS